MTTTTLATSRAVHRVWVLEGDDLPSVEITGTALDRHAFCRDCCEGQDGDVAQCLAWAAAHASPGAQQCPVLTGLAS